MKKGWILLACIGIIVLPACQGNANKKKNEQIKTDTVSMQQPVESDLMFITEWVGKYPKDVNLFDRHALNERLKALLKDRYDIFIANWNTETPLMLTDSIIHASGCKAHDCSALSYDMYIDLSKDNINIYAITDGTVSVFTEKDTIALPKKLKDELRIIISNAKFKPVNKKETSVDSVKQTVSE